MSQSSSDSLHLWFKPNGGVLNDSELAFVENYARRLYPRAMTEVAKQLHRLIARVSRGCPAGMFEYHMTHITKHDSNRYLIQESLCELSPTEGLSMGIQASTPEERQMFAECFENEEGFGQSVQSVIAYLEDSLQMEAERWENVKMQNGFQAMPVLMDVIAFLKAVKNHVRVHTFELNHGADGKTLTIALLSPRVLSYYTRIDWKIV